MKMMLIPKRVLLAVFSICVIVIAMRHISANTLVLWEIDKLAHMSVSFLLAVICLWIFQLRYHTNEQKAKKAAFIFVLAFGIMWEASEFFGVKPAIFFAFPGIQSGGWNYGLDTGLDLIFDACGALWYLYSSEMFLSSSDSDPVP